MFAYTIPGVSRFRVNVFRHIGGLCGVFRAIETRKPLVIAANGGISAWIDHYGRVRSQSPRMKPDIILADVELSSMQSLYLQFGDWFAVVCLTLCGVFAIVDWRTRHTSPTDTRHPTPDT